MKKLKVLTIVGTRPEIIRLAPTIKKLSEHTNHVLVHTGQNYDESLNQVFFEDLHLSPPAHYLAIDTNSVGSAIASLMGKVEGVLRSEEPDAVLILGDTNSGLSAIIAKKMKIPIFHMEAGNRCFDEDVPEEANRKIIDHTADYNLVYTEHARRNLLSEGIHPSRILLTGSPMYEVLATNEDGIKTSAILEKLNLKPRQYFLASLHREENVDNPLRLRSAIKSFNELSKQYCMPVLVSTHPRTRKKLTELGVEQDERIIFHDPFGFNDYNALQVNAKAVLSDSGTISEESTILNFPAVTLRDSIERPEAQDAAKIILTGVDPMRIMRGVEIALALHSDIPTSELPNEYFVPNVSDRVLSFIESTAPSHSQRVGFSRRYLPITITE